MMMEKNRVAHKSATDATTPLRDMASEPRFSFFAGSYREGRGRDAEAIERAVEEEERQLAREAASADVVRRTGGPPAPPSGEPGASESTEEYHRVVSSALAQERPELFRAADGLPLGLAAKRFAIAELQRRGPPPRR